ncbi:MAG: carbonic anhydrase [Akkermansiaceae bacterium]|nr:carbonic anhydrase [Akkermansiaceae bacterium]
MIDKLEALHFLRTGNERFAAGESGSHALDHGPRRNELVAGQNPFAIILGCSDSRVPAELIFDQGLGDLFVIRIAGNVVAPSQIGSIEFAVERFGTGLVVVLGHSGCGAVAATIEEMTRPRGGSQSSHLRSIVERVRPSVEPFLETEIRDDPDELMRLAVRANVRFSANHLRCGSEFLEQCLEERKLLIVGAEYSLETGLVDFFDGLPDGNERVSSIQQG